MDTLYCLEVCRANYVAPTEGRRIKGPDLYVKIKLGNEERKTRVARKTASSEWNDRFTLKVPASTPNPDLVVKLKDNSGLFSKTLGTAIARLSDLLQSSYEGKLLLYALHRRPFSSRVTGTVFLNVKVVDEKQRAEAELNSASADVEQFTLPSLPLTGTQRGLGGDDGNLDGQRDSYQSLVNLFEKTQVFLKVFDTIAAFHPYAYAAWKAISVLHEAVRMQIELDQRAVGLVQLMAEIYEFVNQVDSLQDKIDLLQSQIIEFLRQSTECCLFIRQYSRAGFTRRIRDMGFQVQKIAQFETRLSDLKKSVVEGASLQTTFVSARVSEKVEVMYLRQILSPIEMDAASRPGCLPGTRIDYLDEIMGWLFSERDQNILLLRGVAGCGKSTISTTVSDVCRSMGRLGAYLFFVRGESDPNSVIRTIAYWLSFFDQTIARNVTEAVKVSNSIASASLEKQFEKLLLEPLTTAAKSMQGPIVIILDALDECGSPEARRMLLKLITDSFPKLPNAFRFLITSRNESDFNKAFVNPSVYHIQLHHSSKTGRADVRRYIDYEMQGIFADMDIEVPSDWPWDENVALLSRTADGLFVWASTAIKHVRSKRDNPVHALENLLSYCRTKETAPRSSSQFGLSELYDSVLRYSGISWDDEDSKERFSQVLALILLGKVPLSITAIDGLLGFQRGSSCRFIIACLQSVLVYTPGDPDAPVRIFHTSFSDYLVSPEREGQSWFIDIPKQRYFFAGQCFHVMEKNLRFNICKLDNSFVRNDQVNAIENTIKSNIPPALVYSCRFWAEHLNDVPYSSDTTGLSKKLGDFAELRLLYWLEVLSLTKHFIRSAGSALLEAIRWIPIGSSGMRSFLWDSYWLISVFSVPISQSVPHIYLSTLALTKGVSVVADHYSKLHPTVRISSFGLVQRITCLKVFRKSSGGVNAVAFSPDGKRIVSGSKNKSIHVWDAESGENIARPFSGHTGAVLSVSFSHDGKRIVSGSYDETIYVWNAENGDILSGPLIGHEGAVLSVAMSPDGRSIVSGSGDGTIRIWNALDGKPMGRPIEGYGGIPCSLAFSPDSKRVVSGFVDGTIQVCDRESGRIVVGPFKGHKECICAVAFSPNGKHIASGSGDMSICIWDAETGVLVSYPFPGHTGPILSVAFAPHGNHIASGSGDKTVRVWDVRSGELISGPFKGHAGPVFSVVFSPDGKRIASGSGDETIRIWDARSEELGFSPIEGHTKQIHSIAVSPDGSRIVSGSSDMTVCIWSAEGSLICGPLEGHTGAVLSVAYSPCGTKIASGSLDETIRIWDAEDGTFLGPPRKNGYMLSGNYLPGGEEVTGLVGNIIRAWFSENGELVYEPVDRHTGPVYSVAFSPNGALIASGSADKTVGVWDANGDGASGFFRGHQKGVTSVAFSHSGRHIVSGSHDETVRVWHVGSGELLFVSRVHTGAVYSVAFSPDGNYIVSGSYDKTVRIWDIFRSHVIWRPFTGHTGCVYSVSFSPDGRYVISSSEDKTIRVWSMSGKARFAPIEGHTDGVRSVKYFPDGRRIVSCSRDKVIRVWNVEGSDASFAAESPPVDLLHDSLYERFLRNTHCIRGARYAANTGRGFAYAPEDTGDSSEWTISEDGWLVGRQGELLLWIPSDMLTTLWRPSNTAVFNSRFSIRPDFAESTIGEGWHKGYKGPGV